MFLSYFLIAQGITNSQNTLGQSEEMSDTKAKNHEMGMSMEEENPIEKLIPPITEWVGIFSLGIFAGLFILKTNQNESIVDPYHKTRTRTRNLIIVIAVLSISVGIIHVLLVPEHSQESWIWGVIFLTSGLAQIGYGIIVSLIGNGYIRNALYYIGIIGNIMLAATFVLVRLISPPFSSEGTPINELEPNGIITLVIEIVLIILLGHQLKHKDDTKESIK
ncbi:MAG: hypothetical protein P0116_13835 [Candidatus Nitrosocosmicus sp.]|nr:hypothetical protein [Candidatus Nitrosocosmicus sp.]